MTRAWLAAQLRGEAWPAPGVDDAAAALEREGVAALLHELWQAQTPEQDDLAAWRHAAADQTRTVAMRQLLQQSETRRIGAALAAAGIECLWLKGAALSQWLYPKPHLRPSGDLDVLFASHADALRAADVLAPLGYRLPIRHIAGDLYVYELLAVHAHHGLELDLHWRLANTALVSERLQWTELRAAAIALPGLGEGALALGPVHALLHACLHRACNQLTGGADRLLWLYDLHLLAHHLADAAWPSFVELAIERRIAEPCLDALRASARELGTPLRADIMQRLHDAGEREWLRSARLSDWTYVQRATLRELPDLRARLRWLRQLLIGDLAHVRERYGGDGETRIGRLLGRRLADGFRRWRGYRG